MKMNGGILYLVERSSSSPPQPQYSLENPFICINCSCNKAVAPPKRER